MHCSSRAGQIDAATVKKIHFGGLSDEDEGDYDSVWDLNCPYSVTDSLSQPLRKKAKGEVMEEAISKGKDHRVSESATSFIHTD